MQKTKAGKPQSPATRLIGEYDVTDGLALPSVAATTDPLSADNHHRNGHPPLLLPPRLLLHLLLPVLPGGHLQHVAPPANPLRPPRWPRKQHRRARPPERPRSNNGEIVSNFCLLKHQTSLQREVRPRMRNLPRRIRRRQFAPPFRRLLPCLPPTVCRSLARVPEDLPGLSTQPRKTAPSPREQFAGCSEQWQQRHHQRRGRN